MPNSSSNFFFEVTQIAQITQIIAHSYKLKGTQKSQISQKFSFDGCKFHFD